MDVVNDFLLEGDVIECHVTNTTSGECVTLSTDCSPHQVCWIEFDYKSNSFHVNTYTSIAYVCYAVYFEFKLKRCRSGSGSPTVILH